MWQLAAAPTKLTWLQSPSSPVILRHFPYRLHDSLPVHRTWESAHCPRLPPVSRDTYPMTEAAVPLIYASHRPGPGTRTHLKQTNHDSTLDADNTPNWHTNGGTATTYHDFDFVRFDDTATSHTVTLAQTLTPSDIIISNNATYSFNGGGALAGSTALTKCGIVRAHF